MATRLPTAGFLLVVSLVLAVPLAPRPAAGAGPWRAQVLDAETGAPLDGVAVVAVWHRRARGHPAIGVGPTGFHAAEEAVTGADGRFSIPARLLLDAPPLFPIEGPALSLFRAGYGGWRFQPGRAGLAGDGAVIEMRPLKTSAERLKYLEGRRSLEEARALAPWRQGERPEIPVDVPWQAVERFDAAVNAERAALGLRPGGLGYPGLWTEQAPPLAREPAGAVGLRGASGLALDAQGHLYVADTDNHRIVKLSPALQPLATWGGFGRRDGEMQLPRGVAVDGDTVYVADWGNRRIQKFTLDGRFLGKWGELRYNELGGAFTPTAVATTRTGEVVVYTSARVFRFTRDGSLIGAWGDSSQFAGRSGIAVDAQGHVYGITGHPAPDRPQVMKRDRDGKELASWGRHGQQPGELFDPIALAIDGRGRLHVACWGGSSPRIVVFDAAGAFVHQWDGGSGLPPLRYPSGLAIDAEGAVYVTDLRHPRVHRLAPPARPLTPQTK